MVGQGNKAFALGKGSTGTVVRDNRIGPGYGREVGFDHPLAREGYQGPPAVDMRVTSVVDGGILKCSVVAPTCARGRRMALPWRRERPGVERIDRLIVQQYDAQR